jgi:hypothetical protein
VLEEEEIQTLDEDDVDLRRQRRTARSRLGTGVIARSHGISHLQDPVTASHV